MSKNNMSWWSSLLSSSGGLFDSLANLFSGGQWNKVALRDQRKANEKFYNYSSALDWEYAQKSMRMAADINKEQYAYEYGLESPRARVQQFKEAGLNSGLMYSGAGGTGMQGSVGTVNASPVKGSTPSISYPQSTLSSVTDIMKLASEIEVNKSQADANWALADERRGLTPGAKEDVFGKQLENRIKAVDARVAEATENEQIGITKERYEQLKNENRNLMMDLTVKFSQVERNTAEADLIREQIYGQMVNNAILEIKYQYQQDISKAELELKKAEIEKCFADTAYVKQLKLTEKQKTELQEQLVVAQEQINKIGAVQAKHATDGFGRTINRLNQVAGVVGKIFGANATYVHGK